MKPNTLRECLLCEDLALFAEFIGAVAALRENHFRWFRDRGADGKTIFGGPALFGVGRVRFEGDRYSPDPQGEPAVIVAAGACDEWGWRCVDDLIAYLPREPGRWALRHGDEAVLGRSALVDARMRGEPVMLFQHPHEWILNGSAGAVVIDWRGALLPWFREVKVLATESGIAARLQRHLDGEVANQSPEIRVCEARDAA